MSEVAVCLEFTSNDKRDQFLTEMSEQLGVTVSDMGLNVSHPHQARIHLVGKWSPESLFDGSPGTGHHTGQTEIVELYTIAEQVQEGTARGNTNPWGDISGAYCEYGEDGVVNHDAFGENGWNLITVGITITFSTTDA